MPALIRSASLSDYADVARSVGLDPYRQLRAVGLDRACLDDPDVRIPAQAVRQLLENSAAASGLDDFGLRMAERRGLSNLGPIGFIAREQPTVRKALESMGHYMRLHNEALSLRIADAGPEVVIGVDLRTQHTAARQANELAVAVLFRILKLFLGARWRPSFVSFVHAGPRKTAAHERFFGGRVEFGGNFSGIVCSTRDIDAPIASADPTMARYARRYLDDIAGPARRSLEDQIRELICVLLPAGRASAERVARHLGIDRRTLDRRLARRRRTFLAILNNVRADLCMRYLEAPDRPLTAVADLLGFSSLSAFSRWFRGQFGHAASDRQTKRRLTSGLS